MKFRLMRDCLLRAVIVVLLTVGVALFATSAIAANVDYEDKSVGPVPAGTELVFDHPLHIQGSSDSEIADGVACAPNCPNNGTKYQLSFASGFAGTISIAGDPIPVSCDPAECNAFDLFTIDIAEPLPGSGPILVLFTGFTVGGESPSFEFTTDGVMDGAGGQPDFETVVLPDTFRNVYALGIVAAAPYVGVAIDNLVVEPVQPVPALAPFGLGALALVLCVTATWFGRARATVR
jgi:hypothetical protein